MCEPKKYGQALKEKTILVTGAFIVMAGLVIFMSAGDGYAFHEGGVGYCEGCHISHPSSENQSNVADEFPKHMLKGSDPSSSCLRCHSEKGRFYNVYSDDGSIYSPGGDFYWLKKTFTFRKDRIMSSSEGDNHGHNIVAADYGLNADSKNSSAPEDSYPSTAMGCTSCHNPHGMVSGNNHNSKAISVSGSYGETPAPGTISGNFRLLGGAGYDSGDQANSFEYPAPVAVADSGDWSETDSNHTAYGSGMSEWCVNCHSSYITDNNKHPSGNNRKLGTTIMFNYNSYVKTGNFTGTQADAYLSLVPFELGVTDKLLLDPSSTSGPGVTGKANVMCLTCHRAHASAFSNIGRWDFQTTFIADSHPKAGDGGVTGNDVLNSYYGRNMVAEFGKYQRQLCNKCHSQD